MEVVDLVRHQRLRRLEGELRLAVGDSRAGQRQQCRQRHFREITHHQFRFHACSSCEHRRWIRSLVRIICRRLKLVVQKLRHEGYEIG